MQSNYTIPREREANFCPILPYEKLRRNLHRKTPIFTLQFLSSSAVYVHRSPPGAMTLPRPKRTPLQFDGPVTKRPSQSRDLYRLLRTLKRSDPAFERPRPWTMSTTGDLFQTSERPLQVQWLFFPQVALKITEDH